MSENEVRYLLTKIKTQKLYRAMQPAFFQEIKSLRTFQRIRWDLLWVTQLDLYHQLLGDLKPLRLASVGLKDERKDVELGAVDGVGSRPTHTDTHLCTGSAHIMVNTNMRTLL